MRTRVLALALALWACSDDDPAPLTPGGGPGHEVGVNLDAASDSDDDAGASADAGDAGDAGDTDDTVDAGDSTEAPLRYECVRIEPLQYTDDTLPASTATSAPPDFVVTRQAATWRGDCTEPEVVIELSDGSCPLGDGHELEIVFDVNAIEDGLIAFGLNEVPPESETGAAGIRVRYVRPDELDPSGEWGNCFGSSGSIVFYDAPNVARVGDMNFTYDLEVTSCDDRLNFPLRVAGYVEIRLRRTISEVCPRR